MKTLHRYVLTSYLMAFGLAMLVLSFVLSVGLLVKAAEMVVKGLAVRLVLTFIAVGIPESFTFTVPLALLVSSLLVFGRISADGEISAMKSCGVNLWSVMRGPILFGVLMTLLCAYVNNEVSPRSHRVRRTLMSTIGMGTGLKLLEPGRFIEDFPGITFSFERREGNMLYNVLIFDKTRSGVSREIRAETALVETVGDDIRLDMRKVRVDPFYEDQPGAALADRLVHTIPNAIRKRTYRETIEDYGFQRMLQEIHVVRTKPLPRGVPPEHRQRLLADRAKQERKIIFELNRRFALAAAAVSFVLLGMPLGIRAHRRESTAGVAISLGVMLLYYMFVIGADTLVNRPELQPNLLAWAPALICLGCSLWLVRRHQ